MELWLDEEWLKAFYEVLVDIYKETEDPITVGYNKSMIQVCIERPLTDIYDIIPFPHLLHKASVLMETIINFHPFADGNKRVALLATFYFLYWNGYNFTIPENAADFTIEIAEGKHNLDSILTWLMKNGRTTVFSILRNKVFYFCISLADERFGLSVLIEMLAPYILPIYPITFFTRRIRLKKKQKPTDKR
jgi:death-on-curing protein